jgi:hypothetical protein
MESLDCFNCGSVLIDCSSCLICLAFSSVMIFYGAMCACLLDNTVILGFKLKV